MFRDKISLVFVGVFFHSIINFRNEIPSDDSTQKVSVNSTQLLDAPKYWGICLWNWNERGNLRTMNRVFNRLGYISVNGSRDEDWDVLWSIEYPFDSTQSKLFNPVFKQLKPHQRINHFPGIGYIADKSFMSSRNRNVKAILPGFRFPRMIDEFKTFLKENPKARFVEKSKVNRGIKLVKRSEIVYDKSNKFYQLFMEKPFLVEGRFIDFSTFILISSIDPLRIYRFNEEIHLRFCPIPYYPFNSKVLDKYVIGKSRILYMDHPTTKKYFEPYGYSSKDAVEHYMQQKGHNVTELWRKIDDTIIQLILNNENNILTEVSI